MNTWLSNKNVRQSSTENLFTGRVAEDMVADLQELGGVRKLGKIFLSKSKSSYLVNNLKENLKGDHPRWPGWLWSKMGETCSGSLPWWKSLQSVSNPTTQVSLESLNSTFYSVPPPGSGAILAYILNMLDLYKIKPKDDNPLLFHRIVETFK